jgi:DNA-binding Lrp family transcriptional regulator
VSIADKDVIKYMEWPSSLMKERPTYWQIAKKIGKSPNYVKNMIDEMIQNESLLGMSVFINPTIVGLKSYFVVVSSSNSTVFENEKFREEIGGIYSMHFSGMKKEVLNIEMYKENDEQVREAIDKIRKFSPESKILYSTYENYEQVSVDPKSLEIISYLIKSPMESINRISLGTGIPRGVVKKKIEKMTSGDIISIRPNFNAYRYRKLNLAVMSVAYQDDMKRNIRSQVTDILCDYIIQERKNINGILVFLTNFSHLDDAKPSIDKIEKIPGVLGVTFVFPFESNFYVPELLKERFEMATGKPWDLQIR